MNIENITSQDMETKTLADTNAKTVAPKTPDPLVSFLDRFLTHDNFWNIMFFEMVVIGFVIATFFESVTVFWICFVISSIITYKGQKLSINPEGVFVNRDGEKLNDRYPHNAVIMIILSIATFLLGISIFIKMQIYKYLSVHIELFIIFSTSLFVWISYFLYINCPISILFFARAWTPEVTRFEFRSSSNNQFSDSVDPLTTRTNPRFSHLSQNIFNHSNHR